jgi:hypothetical protein
VRFQRFTMLVVLLAPLLGATLQGCSTPGVGDPCLPEQIPATGFDDSEAYIESSSVQCETRVCLVYHLKGDPRPGCTPSTAPACDPANKNCIDPPTCAPQTEVEKFVYCSCRCNAGKNSGFAACQCPTGFSCQEVLTQGGPGVRGSYCIRKGTATQ